MAITQIGKATASDELIQHIKAEAQKDLKWGNLTDAPDPGGNSGKFLGVTEPSDALQWLDLPPSGLVWKNADADLTAEVSTGYLVSGGITITLPAAPSEGTIVAIADDKAELMDNPITILGNGSNINGDLELLVDMKNACFQLIFDATEWRITQLNHPTNLSQISEETFTAGSLTYSLSRIPPTKTSILVSINGSLLSADSYNLNANVLELFAPAVGQVVVRHIGIAPATQLADAPVGMVGMFPRARIATGWLQAVGGSVGKALYPDLVEYLTGDPAATEAIIPDYTGRYLKGWDRNALVSAYSIPTDLSDNRYGRWMDTLESSSARYMWDFDPANTSQVKLDADGGGYIGYSFDEKVRVDSVLLDVRGGGSNWVPSSMILQSSDDGVNWVDQSTAVGGPSGGTGQLTFTCLDTVTTHKHWRILGTGGTDNGSGYYWKCGFLRFTGDITWNHADNRVDSVAHAHDMAAPTTFLADTSTITTGSDPLITSVPVTTNATSASEPDHAELVVCIKAFHTQGGEIAQTDVDDLREEVNRLAGIHEDIYAQDADITGEWNVDTLNGGKLTIETAGGIFPVLTAEDGSGKIEFNVVSGSYTDAEADTGYLVDVSGQAEDTVHTINLPDPALPDFAKDTFVVVADYNGEVDQSRGISINPINSRINGEAGSFLINVRNVQLTFTYVDLQQGWRITNGLGESEAPSAIRDKVEYTNVKGQKVFAVNYEVGYVEVYYNGRKLSQDDFAATSGTGIALIEPVDEHADVVEIVGYNHVPISDGAHVIPYKEGLTVGTMLDFQVNPNELINGYLQVWQRPGDRINAGQPVWDLGVADNPFEEKYGPDRWVAVAREQGGAAIMERIDHSGNLRTMPGNTNRRSTVRLTSAPIDAVLDTMALEQRVEGVETGAGAELTVTFTYQTELPEISFEIGRYYGSSGGTPGVSEPGIVVQKIQLINDMQWHTQSFTFTVPDVSSLTSSTVGSDDNDYISLTFWMSAGSNYDARTDTLGIQSGIFGLAEVKVEGGSIPTPMVVPYTSEELAKCQRYYQSYTASWPFYHVSIHGAMSVAGALQNVTQRAVSYQFSTTMRTAPSMLIMLTDHAATTNQEINSQGFSAVYQTVVAGNWGGLTSFTADAEL